MSKDALDELLGSEVLRPMENDGKIHVESTHWIDANPLSNGKVMLVRVEVYPIPAEFGAKLQEAMTKLAVEMLDKEGLSLGDWEARSNSLSEAELAQAAKNSTDPTIQ